MPHVTFIHGIGNKPPEADLVRSWVAALADDGGVDLDYEAITYDMVYWAHLLYAEPLRPGGGQESLESVDFRGAEEADMGWLAAASGDEAEVMSRLAARVGFTVAASEPLPDPVPHVDEALELLPAPIARRLMKTFLRDVHAYLYNVRVNPRPEAEYQVRDDIRRLVIDKLQTGAKHDPPHVMITHSLGTVIAYDVLQRVPDCPAVNGLITIGTPLGLDEVQHCLKPEWTRRDGYPARKLGGPWVNVFDRLDLVAAADPAIANDYERGGQHVVVDVLEPNWGRWRHDIGKYLRGPKLRAHVAEILGLERQP